MRLLSVVVVLTSLFLSSCGLTSRIIQTTSPNMPKALAQLPRLSQPLALDGELKEWDSAISMPVRGKYYLGRTENAPPASKLKSGMEVFAAWNDEGLCFFCKAADPKVTSDLSKDASDQDGIEIQIDGRTGSKYLSKDFSDGAILVSVRPPLAGGHGAEVAMKDGKAEGLKVAGRVTAAGYDVEVMVPWTAIPQFTHQVGSHLGLQFVLNENDSGDSKSRAIWYIQPDAKFKEANSRFVEFELTPSLQLSKHTNLIPAVAIEAPDSVASQIARSIQVEAGESISPRIAAFKCRLVDSRGECLWKESAPASHKPEPWQKSIQATFHFPATETVNNDCRLMVIAEDSGGKTLGFAERVMSKGADQRSEQIRNLAIKPENDWDHILRLGPLPKIVWSDSALAQELFGNKIPRIRWFNSDLEEVESAEKPGRYAAYAEGHMKDGRTIRRVISIYANDSQWEPWREKLEVKIPDAMFPNVKPGSLAPYKEKINQWANDAIVSSLYRDEMGASMCAALQNSNPNHPLTQFDLPDTQNLEFLMAVRGKAMGGTRQFATLQMPHRTTGAPAMAIHKGALADAGMKPDAPERIRKVAAEWTQASGVPNTIMIVRHGIIVFHEAFGSIDKTTSTSLDSKFGTASITKLHAGLLLAQFIDQGIIALDDPVGKFLPDFPTTGAKVLTIRECMDHTSGLKGHGDWGGINNPFLDNVIGCSPDLLKPGEVVEYNGMGIDLTGKIMEAASGKNIYRLMQENFFIPLGQNNPNFCDLGFGLECTSEDLARVGQLMMNKGTYGDTIFFSPETFKKVAPLPLKDIFPALKDSDWSYGAGITTMNEYRPDSGKNGTIGSIDGPIPQEKLVLTKGTMGHGSASGCILRVDPVNDLVVTMVRRETGEQKIYDKYVSLLMQAIVDSQEK